MGALEKLTKCFSPGDSLEWPRGLGDAGHEVLRRPPPHGYPHPLSLQGQEMARSVGAVAYLECSALLHENVHAVFQEAAEVALSSRSRNLWRRITRSFCVVT